MIILRQKTFTSKATKALRRKELIKAAEHSFEKDNADKLLKEGKISKREYEQIVFKKGRERLGISKPIFSDGGYTINLENIPSPKAGLVNSNYKGKYSTAGKSKIQRNAVKAETRRMLNEYRTGGLLETIGTSIELGEMTRKAAKKGKISEKRARELIREGEDALIKRANKLEKAEELWKKAAKLEKKAKKVAPWALGAAALAGTGIAASKAIKKKKSEKK